jgi:hypothetical protein
MSVSFLSSFILSIYWVDALRLKSNRFNDDLALHPANQERFATSARNPAPVPGERLFM